MARIMRMHDGVDVVLGEAGSIWESGAKEVWLLQTEIEDTYVEAHLDKMVSRPSPSLVTCQDP